MKKLRNKVEELNRQYEELKDEINGIKAGGSLSKLCNLMSEFDETFDQFFDDIELRKKYSDYDFEEECIKFEKGNSELLEELDREDLENYIEFYTNYIGKLEDELIELEMKESFGEI